MYLWVYCDIALLNMPVELSGLRFQLSFQFDNPNLNLLVVSSCFFFESVHLNLELPLQICIIISPVYESNVFLQHAYFVH
jgi:hypothetical protein